VETSAGRSNIQGVCETRRSGAAAGRKKEGDAAEECCRRLGNGGEGDFPKAHAITTGRRSEATVRIVNFVIKHQSSIAAAASGVPAAQEMTAAKSQVLLSSGFALMIE
jgi:hypothetical protein